MDGLDHVLTYDNWFTFANLFYDLCLRGIYATGTCRVDRIGWTHALTQKENRERGTLLYRMHLSNRIVAVSWCDKKAVNLLSTAVSLVDKDGSSLVQ